jgi:hypothetical protein
MRVVPLESPLKGHQPLYVFDFLISVLNIWNNFKILSRFMQNWTQPPACSDHGLHRILSSYWLAHFYLMKKSAKDSLPSSRNPKNNWCLSRIYGVRFSEKDRGLSTGIFKSEIKKLKTYSGWCPFKGLSNDTTLMQIQSGRTEPLNSDTITIFRWNFQCASLRQPAAHPMGKKLVRFPNIGKELLALKTSVIRWFMYSVEKYHKCCSQGAGIIMEIWPYTASCRA